MKWVNSLSFISRLWGQAHDYTVEGSRPWWSSIRQKPVLLSGLTRIGRKWNPDQGVPFEESEAYLMNKDKVDALIRLPTLKKSYTAVTLPTCCGKLQDLR